MAKEKGLSYLKEVTLQLQSLGKWGGGCVYTLKWGKYIKIILWPKDFAYEGDQGRRRCDEEESPAAGSSVEMCEHNDRTRFLL